jgi:hypothetical protein
MMTPHSVTAGASNRLPEGADGTCASYQELLGGAVVNVLSELGAEDFQVALEEADVAPHHTKVRNLPALEPKIHCLGLTSRNCSASLIFGGLSASSHWLSRMGRFSSSIVPRHAPRVLVFMRILRQQTISALD